MTNGYQALDRKIFRDGIDFLNLQGFPKSVNSSGIIVMDKRTTRMWKVLKTNSLSANLFLKSFFKMCSMWTLWKYKLSLEI